MRCSIFIKIAFRNIILHRVFSLMTLIGLSVGIAIALLVLAYVNYETSYDTNYPDSKNIYRLNSYGRIGNDTINCALTPLPLANIAASFPGVESCTRLVPESKKLIKSSYARFNESKFYYADKGFFKVFNIPFLLGNPMEVFSDTNAVVISRSAGLRYFGNRNPLGEKLTLDNGLVLKVSGVYYDLPQNTHLKVDLIANWDLMDLQMKEKFNSDYKKWNDNWFILNTYSYLKVNDSIDVDSLQSYINKKASIQTLIQVKSIIEEGLVPDMDNVEIKTRIQPITDIHLNTNIDQEIQKGANPTYVLVFAGIAIFILVISAINFMNLTTARASRRFKEVAIRKAYGAGRGHLIFQFFIESISFCFLALAIALVFMELFFSQFRDLFDISLGEGSFLNHLNFGWVMLITLIVGIIAGSYPSFFFSGLKASKIFKGQIRPRSWGIIIRGVLVAFQICIAVALMSISLGMFNQLRFLKEAPLGYDPNHVIALEREYAFGEKTDSVKQLLTNSNEIKSVSSVHCLPGDETSIYSYKNLTDTSQIVLLATDMVDSLFFNTIGAELVNGRTFNRADLNDSSVAVINESAAMLLGFTDLDRCRLEVIGSKHILNVVGIVKDIHYESLRNQVTPMVYIQKKAKHPSEYLLIRFNQREVENGIRYVENLWNSVLPEEPFEFFYLSERGTAFYREELRFARIGVVFAFLSLIFAVLGLIGMVSFVVHSKYKNMEISRALSASSSLILIGAFRGIAACVFAGIFSSLLISPFVIDYWLSGFYYSFSISGYCIVIPIVIMSLISFFIVYFVGIKVFRSVVQR